MILHVTFPKSWTSAKLGKSITCYTPECYGIQLKNASYSCTLLKQKGPHTLVGPFPLAKLSKSVFDASEQQSMFFVGGALRSSPQYVLGNDTHPLQNLQC